jgi:hypothetical protein
VDDRDRHGIVVRCEALDRVPPLMPELLAARREAGELFAAAVAA